MLVGCNNEIDVLLDEKKENEVFEFKNHVSDGIIVENGKYNVFLDWETLESVQWNERSKFGIEFDENDTWYVTGVKIVE